MCKKRGRIRKKKKTREPKKKNLTPPGIELGSPAWEAGALPLSHAGTDDHKVLN